MMRSYYLIACLVLVLTGCGGGGGSSSNTAGNNNGGNSNGGNSDAPAVAVQTGFFLDSPVINLGYRTETQKGFTDALGQYNYLEGEAVVFFIGDLEFPPVIAKKVVTPLDLAGTSSVNDTKVVNMIRLLQTLDKDGDPGNGIKITRSAATSATQVDFGLSESDFEAHPAVNALINNAGLNTEVASLVDRFTAIRHFVDETVRGLLGPSAFQSGVIVTGNTIGDGSAANSDLRKKINFTITNPDARLSFSDAYAAKSSQTDLDTIFWMVFVINTSAQNMCFVSVRDGVYKDSQGQELITEKSAFVAGSVRLVKRKNSTVSTNTCLLPGEKGLLSSVQSAITTGVPNLYADTSEIVFDRIDRIAFSTVPSTPLSTVITHTDTYESTPDADSSPEVSVLIQNTSVTTGEISTSRFVLLDDEGLPLKWGILDAKSQDKLLDSGDELSIAGEIVFDGTSNSIHAYINYKDFVPSITPASAGGTAERSDTLSGDEYTIYLNDIRNQTEEYKASLVAE